MWPEQAAREALYWFVVTTTRGSGMNHQQTPIWRFMPGPRGPRFCAKPGRTPLVPAYYREVIPPFTAAFLPAAFRQPILCLGRITVGRVLLGSRRLRDTVHSDTPYRSAFEAGAIRLCHRCGVECG